MGYADIIDNISEALSQSDGEHIAEIHNQICCQKVVYLGDSVWEEREADNDYESEPTIGSK